jgi:hypothetical protein
LFENGCFDKKNSQDYFLRLKRVYLISYCSPKPVPENFCVFQTNGIYQSNSLPNQITCTKVNDKKQRAKKNSPNGGKKKVNKEFCRGMKSVKQDQK